MTWLRIFGMLLTTFSQVYGQSAARFVGTTPCAGINKSFMGISPQIPCDIIKWELTLTGDGLAGGSTFKLKREFLHFVDNRTSVSKGSAVIEGKWKSVENPNPVGRTYALQNANTELMFLQVGANLLHFMNSDKRLLVGNGGWSYTLNRVSKNKLTQN